MKASYGLLAALLMLIATGCETLEPGPQGDAMESELPPALRKVEQLYQEGRYSDALVMCVDLTRQTPDLPRLSEMREKVLKAAAKARIKDATIGGETTRATMLAEVGERGVMPATYGIKRTSVGESGAMKTAPSPMEKALSKPVTVHLENASLDDFILAVGSSENINIISDSGQSSRRMTIHADKVPLSEILDYVSRNLGVSFYSGHDIIWATPQASAEPAVPLETRIYRLRKGLSNKEISSGDVHVVEAIKRFVPTATGSDILFDERAHVLIVRNTRENLAKAEDIITSLDVCPPQVLIEARFMSTQVSDLRELGIEWLLNSPLILSKETVQTAAGQTKAIRTQIAQGAGIQYPDFPNKGQGLEFVYQGLLTDPMFQAVIHALDISGKARTLSVPKVATVNNQEANIVIGEEFRWYEQFDIQSVPSSVTSGGNTVYASRLVPVGSPQTKQLGISLSVTPSVGADLRSITLKLKPSIDEFVRYEVYETGDANNSGVVAGQTTNATSLVKLPIFATRKIETEVVVQSGETVVMGGLITTTESRDMNRVPFLGSLPLIGFLFRNESVTEKKGNLLIFVTARLISELGEDMIPIAAGAGREESSAAPAASTARP